MQRLFQHQDLFFRRIYFGLAEAAHGPQYRRQHGRSGSIGKLGGENDALPALLSLWIPGSGK